MIQDNKLITIFQTDILLNSVSGDLSTLLAQASNMHLQNRRQGTVAVKDRSLLLSRSKKKPWKQKGTGRARAGTTRSPLWRGGGVALGPVMRVGRLDMSKKQRSLTSLLTLSEKIKKQMVISLNYVPMGKCNDAFKVLNNLQLSDKKIVLLYNNEDKVTYYSFSNLPFVHLVSYDAVFSYILADNSYVVFLEKDSSLFNGLVKEWQKRVTNQ